MAASVAEHFADVIVYWLPSGDYKAKLLNSGRQKPWCEMGGPDGDVIFQRWKEHQSSVFGFASSMRWNMALCGELMRLRWTFPYAENKQKNRDGVASD
jgi:hypothetical protein